MNILFLIGNGFDLNLGMKTRYDDFYRYYSSKKSPSDLIEKLKKEIDRNIENWSDLELELGEYTKNLNSSREFYEVFENVEDELGDYLEEQEKKIDFEEFDRKRLFMNFIFPENAFAAADKNKIMGFKQKWNSSQWNLNVITFNYTRTLEKLIKYKGNPIQINEFVNRERFPVVLQRIEHIHGYTDKRMVLGVNDPSQISNKIFVDNPDIMETLIKCECNQAQKHLVDEWCKYQVSIANLICIFGSSIGDTDNFWWQFIGEQLKRDCLLLIFEIGELISPRRPQISKIAERDKKKYFLSKTKLSEKEKENANNKIFIGINTDLFSIKIKRPVSILTKM